MSSRFEKRSFYLENSQKPAFYFDYISFKCHFKNDILKNIKIIPASIPQVIAGKLRIRFKNRLHDSKREAFLYKMTENQAFIFIIFRLSAISKTTFLKRKEKCH